MKRRQFTFSTSEAFLAVDSERDYQESRWNPETTESHGIHSLSEWYAYMEDYIDEAQHILAREPVQTANPKALDIMRKVVSMGIAAMEQLGCPQRKGYEKDYPKTQCPDCGADLQVIGEKLKFLKHNI